MLLKSVIKPIRMLVVVAVLAGCASQPAIHSTTSALGVATKVALSDKDLEKIRRYSSLMIEPVKAVGQDPAAQTWKDVSDKQRNMAESEVQEAYAKAAMSEIPLVSMPGDGVLRLRLTLVDVKLSNPIRATLGHLSPIGLAVNISRSAQGKEAARSMGSVTIAGELRDATTGVLVASFMSIQSPDPMNISATVDQDSAIRSAIKRSAEEFHTALAASHRVNPG